MIVFGTVMLMVYVGLVAMDGRTNRRIARERAKNVKFSAAAARLQAASQPKSGFSPI
jgi:hypothetical protein